MATTTPNFGWSVPTSTDLVKDGATAIELLGDSIDASLVDLKGGTTGQVLSKTSGTDMDFTWVTTDDTNAIQNAIVDAKGDLIAATAADTPARLAVGTNGQVLTADSTAATGLAWATATSGGMTLISTTALTGASVTTAAIASTYKHLYLVINDLYLTTTLGQLNMRFNSDTGSNYVWSYIRNISTTVAGSNNPTTSINVTSRNASTNTASKKSQIEISLPRYTDTVPRGVHINAYMHDDTNPGNQRTDAIYFGSSAISTITLIPDSNFVGGNLYVYGVS
jgi:hypothetical protein